MFNREEAQREIQRLLVSPRGHEADLANAAMRMLAEIERQEVRIARLEQILAAVESAANAGSLDAQLIDALAKYRGR